MRLKERSRMNFRFPPRPKGKLSPVQLASYDVTGRWLAQRKFNGTRNLIAVSGDTVQLWNREGETHKQFQPTPALLQEIRSLNLKPGLDYYLDGEVLDCKTSTPAYKNKIVLYDVLQAGKYLLGVSTTDRLKLLAEICRNPTEREPGYGIALQVTQNIWMAETFNDHFTDRYKDFIAKDEIEGLVLKRRSATLDNTGRSYYEVDWQIRCRKPHKNYEF
jgi:ATP-dependent DNA ligase